MPRVIFKCPHLKGGGRSAAHLNHYVKYVATREGVEMVERRENYVGYIAQRPRSHGLFTAGDGPVPLSQVADAVARHPGTVWLPIISLQREDAARLGYDCAERWHKLLSAQAADMAKAMKIPLEQFRWYAAFHDEGEHPHVHMVCYSADGRSGFLTKQGIADIKSTLAKEIFQQDLIAVYQRQTQRRDGLTQDAEEVMGRLVSEMQSGTLENVRIGQLMLELARELRGRSGKKQYGYLPAPLKSLVDEVVDELAKDPRIAAAYDLWYEQREEVLRTYKDTLPERVPLSRQKEFQRIQNIIVQEAARLGEPVQAEEKMRTVVDAPPHQQPSASQAGTKAPDLFSVASSIIYHVGQVFQARPMQPVNSLRVAVDSKLRRKIREKKIAMGHKPDDHEEQMLQ